MIEKIFMPPHGNTTKKLYFWTVAAGVIYAGSSFVMSMVTTNLLGAYEAGILAIALSIGTQMVSIGHYNMRAFQVSDVMESYSFSDYVLSRILTIFAMLVGGGIWMAAGGYAKGKLIAIGLMVVFKALEAASDLLEGRYQQKGRYDVACRGVFYKILIPLLGFILTMVMTGNLLWSLSVLTGCYLFMIIVIDRSLIKCFGGIQLTFQWNKQIRLLWACLPLFVNSFLTTYVLSASKYIMDQYYEETFLGKFNALYMMAFVINMLASFGLKPVLSALSAQYVGGDLSGFLKSMKRQFFLLGGITTVCIAGAYVIGIPVLSRLFGMDLSNYRLALCVMLLGGGFTALFQLLQYGIVIMRHQYSSLVGCVVGAVFTLAVTPIFIEKFAVNGAAFSYLCSMGMMSLVFFIIIIYYLRKERREFGEA
jgi:O-antigen/teichoic acid export membrane protein